MISWFINFILDQTDLSDSVKIVKQILSFVLWVFVAMAMFAIIIIDNGKMSIIVNLALGWIGVAAIIESIVEVAYLRTID